MTEFNILLYTLLIFSRKIKTLGNQSCTIDHVMTCSEMNLALICDLILLRFAAFNLHKYQQKRTRKALFCSLLNFKNRFSYRTPPVAASNIFRHMVTQAVF